MLNPLPDLLSFSLLAPFVIRLTLAVYFLRFGAQVGKIFYLSGRSQANTDTISKKTDNRERVTLLCYTLLGFSLGVLFVVGAGTQMAAIISIATLFSLDMHKEKNKGRKEQEGDKNKKSSLVEKYPDLSLAPSALALFALSLSLLFTGAGVFAFDLPL
jgi:uncharacterized membrane protein YphA (DoxX/SURF4 family)